MFRSLQSRLLLIYATLIALGVGTLILLAGTRLTSQVIEQSANELTLQAQLVANGLRDPLEHGDDNNSFRGRSLSSLIASFAQNVDGRVTLVDANLKTIASSDNRVPIQVENNYVEFTSARNDAPRYDMRWDEWSKEQRLFVASPILGERMRPLGFVQLSVPMEPLYHTTRGTWVSLIAIGGMVLLATILASALLARQIAVPIQHLTATSEQIAAGRLDERVAPAGPDEIRRLGVAFNRMTERVQAMLEQQREFVDNAAHELRSPLTGLRLRIEMLQAHGKADAALTERYLGQMEREVGYLQRLVDHLLALAAVEGNEEMPRMSLDLARVIYEHADEMEQVAQHAGLTLQVDVPDHLPRVNANPEQINMVIRNLFDNAVKYTPRGGTITLGAQAANNEIVLRVADTGIGIAPEALPHIFDRFYRADPARSRQQGGTGIGLSLVRAIVEAHGGRIHAESHINKGSVFTVHLPALDQNQKNLEKTR